MVQGFGVLDTGSFMDGRGFWGLMGALMFAGGLATVAVKRRRRDEDH